jgi:hypothetical protein
MREKTPTIKHITRNRKFNVLKVTKKEEFISFDDWKKNFKGSVVGIYIFFNLIIEILLTPVVSKS